MNRDSGLEEAIRAMGSTDALTRALDLPPPAACTWHRLPAEHVLAVEALTGIARSALRPDLYPGTADTAAPARDEIDLARSDEYALLAALLLRPPDSDALARLSRLQGNGTALGRAHVLLAEAAGRSGAAAVEREYFDLFIGVGRGELLPYASYYLTGFLNERPLARLRGDLQHLGLERAEGHGDPEDHLGTLCEIMSGFAGGRFDASAADERDVFTAHLAPWAGRFFTDLEKAAGAAFYGSVGRLGRIFTEIETEAFALEVDLGA